MELIELALENFKKFKSGQFAFCPGINLFWGLNESGKSTVHEAISCALFGRDRGQVVESWDGGPCVVGLSYRSSGKLFRIERRLTEGSAKIGILSGDDLVDAVSAKDEVESLLADHLGIASRQVFDNTMSVRQMGMSSVQASDMDAVGGEIQRILTGTAHVSAAEVLEHLEKKRGNIKGKARPSNPREYDSTTSRLTELAKDLANARHSRDQIRNLEEEHADLEVRITRDSERLTILAELLERHKRWSELKKKEEEVDSRHKGVFVTLKKMKETLADLKFVQKDLGGYAVLVGKDEEVAEHLSKIDSRHTELRTRLEELETAVAETQPSRSPWVPRLLLSFAVLFAVMALAGFVWDQKAFLLLAPSAVCAIAYVQIRTAGQDAKSRRILDMINSAREEMKQLDAEESSILSYMKCKNAGKAWEKIKTYRSLAGRAHELELTLTALLNGRKIEDWEAQEADLDREVSGVRRELETEFSGYTPATEEAEAWRSEHATLQNSLPTAQARLHEVMGSLEAERRNARDLAALEGGIEFLHQRKAEMDFLHKAYDEAISALQAVTQTVSEEYLPALSDSAAGYMGKLTSGRYASICVSPGWEISVDCSDKSAVSSQVLSIGTLDQLYFSLRIACAELLSAGRKLPIVLDDPFASFDRGRLDNVLNLIAALAKENQILLLTHDPYILDWARDLTSSGKTPCAIYELPAPALREFS